MQDQTKLWTEMLKLSAKRNGFINKISVCTLDKDEAGVRMAEIAIERLDVKLGEVSQQINTNIPEELKGKLL